MKRTKQLVLRGNWFGMSGPSQEKVIAFDTVSHSWSDNAIIHVVTVTGQEFLADWSRKVIANKKATNIQRYLAWRGE